MSFRCCITSYYTRWVRFEDVDWSHRADYILDKHNMTVEAANSALRDPDRLVIEPDYNSQSGRGVRIIGYSQVAEEILTVLVIEHGGWEYGLNCWRANDKDRRLYRDGEGA